MSSILVSGVLVNPFNRPLPNAIITLTSISNSFTVLTGANVTSRTNDAGEYEFHLQPGNYAVYVAKDSYRDFYGAITVTATTPPTTLNVLLKQNAMEAELPPDLVEFFQQVQNQVVVVGNGADESARIAAEKAGAAAISETNAGAYKTDAKQSASSAGQSAAISQEIANQLGDINQIIRDAGFEPVDSFEKGFTLTSIGQALRLESNGVFYSWRGSYPKNVPIGSTPETTGGISKTAWVDVNDLTLRGQVTAHDGLKVIGVCPDVETLKTITPVAVGQRIKLRAYHASPWFAGHNSICSDLLGGGTLEAVAAEGLEADDGELFSTPDPTLMWRRVQFGSLTIEQLGAKGLPTDGSIPKTDSWPAFYRAYKIMLRNKYKPIRFKLSMRSYFVSKPIIVTSWMTLETENPEIGVFITYGMQKLTKEDLPDAINVGGQVEEFDKITAQFILQHEDRDYTRRSQLVGIDITNINNLPSDYSIYHTHSNRCQFTNCRFINGVIGEFSRDSYSCKFENVIFQGHSTGLIGSNHIPRGGYNEMVTGCGTSNEYSRVGFSGFAISIEHVNGSYSKFSTCYSEAGTKSPFRFHRCHGYVMDSYGVENVIGIGPDDRFGYLNGSSVTVTGFDSAYNNALGDGAAFVAVNGSQLSLINPNLSKLNSVTGKSIVYGDASSMAFIRGQKVMPGMTVGIFLGQLDIFYTAVNQVTVEGSVTTGSATYSTRNLHYQISGGRVSFQCEVAWTGHSGTGTIQIVGLPYQNIGSTALCPCISPGLSVGGEVVGLINYQSNRMRIVRINTNGGAVEGIGLPFSGSIIISGSYKPEWF